MELGKDVIGKMVQKDVDDYSKYYTNSGYLVEIPIVKQSKKKAFTKSYTKVKQDYVLLKDYHTKKGALEKINPKFMSGVKEGVEAE